MPSYRYTKDIKPEDLKTEEKKEYTRIETIENWFRYHWKILVAVALLLALIIYFAVEMLGKKEPDFSIGVLTTKAVPEEAISALQDALAVVVGDVNGDGSVLIAIDVFSFKAYGEEGYDETADYEEDTSSEEQGLLYNPTNDAYGQMAGVVQFSAVLSDDKPMLFLILQDEYENYEGQYGLLALPDGSSPAGSSFEDRVIAWEDVPFLASLDIKYDDYYGDTVDAQKVFGEYYVGIRNLEDTRLEDRESAVENWEQARDLLREWRAD